MCVHTCVFVMCAHVCGVFVCDVCAYVCGMFVLCAHVCVCVYPNSSSRFIALFSEERQFHMIPELLIYDFISRSMNFSFQVNLL